MFRLSFLAPALLCLGACATLPAQPVATSAAAEQRAPVTILVSIDGFRSDYLARGVTPHLAALAGNGVQASMRPSFPTKTFPNHWAIVTGDRPDRNGIVANSMEDVSRPDDKFTMASDDPYWWSEAEPIWVTAEKAGVRTATMFWPGSNVPWGGTKEQAWPYTISGATRPSDWAQFNQAIDGTQRVNMVLDVLRRPADIRPKFVTLYFDTVDTAGHVYGPDAPETTRALAEVDSRVGDLVDGLKAMGQPANLIILADHGMAASSSERVVALDKVANPADYRVVESGPYATLAAVPGREKALEAALLKPHPHMQCWRKSEIPARFHYGTHRRIPPYFCLGQTGWEVQATTPTKPRSGGSHGWDDRAPEMQALFIANGPAFVKGAKPAPDFTNVDVYPMLARLIGVTPRPSDGNPAALSSIVAQ
ncbi:alkaline phosphatase family protein [Sphingobium abikonense]|uniref:alkaline phosphatase family protein n=1 Tax=Sphingobium abikonense TaxID=86193 RepID=UPI0007888316|nr:ectonucleotide pyrophosphatase/phosphodiesterase [Sphingobium abikonense]